MTEQRTILKGLGHDSEVCLQFFSTPNFDKSAVWSPFNKMTILKLIEHGIELHEAFEERENKQKNAKF